MKYTIEQHSESIKNHTYSSVSGQLYGNRHDTSSLAESSSVTEEFSCSSSG